MHFLYNPTIVQYSSAYIAIPYISCYNLLSRYVFTLIQGGISLIISIPWIPLGIIMFIIYNNLAFKFAAKILIKSKYNLLLNTLFSIINLMILGLIFYFEIPRYYIYLIFVLIMGIEFKIISKAPLNQIIFGSSAFLLNIAPVHLLTIMILSIISTIPTTQYFIEYNLVTQALFFTFLFLTVTLILFEQFIPLSDVQKMSKAKVYSELVSATALIMIINTSVDIWLFVTDSHSTPMTMIMICNAAFSYIIFYYVFLFTTSLVKLHIYKRKSDEADTSYSQLLDKKSKVTEKINTDDFTGLYNRKYVNEKLTTLLATDESSFGIIFMDLAALKNVNDTYGHDAGDRYILKIANVLKETIRDIDTPARIGGDEYLLILEDITADDLPIILKRLRDNVLNANKSEKFLIHANIGSTFVGNETNKPTLTELLENVDQKMREDKRSFYKKIGRII